MAVSTTEVTIIFVVVGLILLGYQSGILKLPGTTPTPKVIAPSKQIISNTLPLEEKWRWSGLVNNFSISAIAVTKNRIAIIEGIAFEQRIHVFDVHTGNSLWNSEYITHIESITADERRVYIGRITDVQAFDLETGERLWRGAVQPSLHRGGFAVFSDGDWVLAYDGIEPDLYILNATTGETIQKITNADLFYRWNDKVDYLLNKSHRYLEAQDIQTGKKLWGQQFSGIIIDTTPPVFFENTMILKIAHQFRGLVGIDIKSGNIKWEVSDKFRFLDVAGLDNVAYALRYDASIVGLDPETGEQVGVLEMTPNRTGEDDGGFATYYGITTSDKYAAVYYGNSQELIVFEKVGGLDNKTQ